MIYSKYDEEINSRRGHKEHLEGEAKLLCFLTYPSSPRVQVERRSESGSRETRKGNCNQRLEKIDIN